MSSPDYAYPTEEELARVTAEADPTRALDLVAELWSSFGSVSRVLTAHEGYLVHAAPGLQHLRLATGGWSGNESLIDALRTNRIVWLFTWRLSACGGLFIFRYPEKADR